jgi:hypothetical protein
LFIGELLGIIAINSPGQQEKISSLSGCQPQYVSYPTKRRAGRRHLLPLLQPRIPGRTDSSHLRNFFAPKTRRPSPSFAGLLVVRRFGDQLPMPAQKLAERSLSHGSTYHRIFCTPIIILRIFQLKSPIANKITCPKSSNDNSNDAINSRDLPNVVN